MSSAQRQRAATELDDRLLLRVPRALKDRLAHAAIDEHRSAADIVRELIEEWLRDRRTPKVGGI